MGGVFRITEEDAARDFGALLARVRAGEEALVQGEETPGVTMTTASCDGETAQTRGKTANEILQSLARWEAEHGTPTFDAGFADDVEEAHKRLNRPLDSSPWD